ncbi:hypothetical protein GCM10018791_05380 [Streptomyces zaomyceticus]|nr:hypothetical protein GCM10018791_05380 [Streptomyces zaomyceticus]
MSVSDRSNGRNALPRSALTASTFALPKTSWQVLSAVGDTVPVPLGFGVSAPPQAVAETTTASAAALLPTHLLMTGMLT